MSIRSISSRFTVTWDHSQGEESKKSPLTRWPSRGSKTPAVYPDKVLPRTPPPGSPSPSPSSSPNRISKLPHNRPAPPIPAQQNNISPLRNTTPRAASTSAAAVVACEARPTGIPRMKYGSVGPGTALAGSSIPRPRTPTIRSVSGPAQSHHTQLPDVTPTRVKRYRDASALSRGSGLPMSPSLSTILSPRPILFVTPSTPKRSVSSPSSLAQIAKPPSPEKMTVRGVAWGTRRKGSNGFLNEAVAAEAGSPSLNRKGSIALDEILIERRTPRPGSPRDRLRCTSLPDSPNTLPCSSSGASTPRAEDTSRPLTQLTFESHLSSSEPSDLTSPRTSVLTDSSGGQDASSGPGSTSYDARSRRSLCSIRNSVTSPRGARLSIMSLTSVSAKAPPTGPLPAIPTDAEEDETDEVVAVGPEEAVHDLSTPIVSDDGFDAPLFAAESKTGTIVLNMSPRKKESATSLRNWTESVVKDLDGLWSGWKFDSYEEHDTSDDNIMGSFHCLNSPNPDNEDRSPLAMSTSESFADISLADFDFPLPPSEVPSLRGTSEASSSKLSSPITPLSSIFAENRLSGISVADGSVSGYPFGRPFRVSRIPSSISLTTASSLSCGILTPTSDIHFADEQRISIAQLTALDMEDATITPSTFKQKDTAQLANLIDILFSPEIPVGFPDAPTALEESESRPAEFGIAL